MGQFRPFPLVGGSYTDDALPWTHQETINYLPVKAERGGSRSPAKLAMVPGMRVFADVGTGPHRGARDVEGKRFVVSGTKLYQITPAGVATEIGTIPGTGRVCMTHNQISGGNQLVIGNGSSGYVYNTYSGAFAQITDDAFPGMIACDFLNQYIIGVEPLRRYWFHSALVDATSYNALDVYQAETSPDRIAGLVALHNEVLVFGDRSIEPWTNTPTETAAFQLQRGSVIESGCASGNTICKLDNSVFYLTENGQIARLNGYVPQIISTYALEGAIKDANWSRAFAFTWEDKGHTVYYITFPEVGTFGYDVRQGEWHRRKSFGVERWRLNTLFKSGGDWLGGDYQNGKLYKLDWSYALDGCDPIERIRSSGYVHKDGERATVNALQVVMDSGAAQSVPHGGVTITGAMPDAFVGDAVDFTYTITGSYPGQQVTLTVAGLPTGLSITDAGHVTGTLAEAGTFAIAIAAVDDCGNEASHDDSVLVDVLPSVPYDVTGIKYKVMVPASPDYDTDLSQPAYDDSAWSTGQGGFGSNTPDGAQVIHTFTATALETRIWVRQPVAMTAGRDCLVEIWRDDGAQFYWNGVAYPVVATGDYYRVTVLVPGAEVTGNDLAAVRVTDGRDDAGNPSGSANIYASMNFQSL